jgi:hypothetical protein
MLIKKSDKYKSELKIILENIAKDKLSAMIKFRFDLNIQIKSIIDMPEKYRKSYYFNNLNISDMIFKSYTIIYEIKKDSIEIYTIFNQNLPTLENLEDK